MNPLALVIGANIAAAFVLFCGIKLFDLGSDFADLIRRHGVFLGLIVAIVTIFNFLLTDTAEILNGELLFWTVFVSMICFAILGRLVDLVKIKLLSSKHKKKKHLSPSVLSVITVNLIELIIGAIYGIAAGASFIVTTGTGVMVLCVFILFRIVGKVETIQQYQEAGFSRAQNIITLIISFCSSPIAAIVTYLLLKGNFRSAGIFMATAAGFLTYISIYRVLTVIVKKYKNR